MAAPAPAPAPATVADFGIPNRSIWGLIAGFQDYAPENMEENDHYQYHQHKPIKPSRLGLTTTGTGGGEIVEVEGGHIVRSTGRKDRHSKVCTAKGPRDRRVRLSAHTAIQFFDVQDRLGYDRPSKAVDWLIKKAKASIDELAELPAWKPTSGSTPVVNLEQNSNFESLNLHRLDQLEEDEEGNNVYFDGSGWPETGGFSGFVFNSPGTLTMPFLQPLFGQTQTTSNQLFNYISQRGPLQSSNTPPVRAWVDPIPFSGSGIDQQPTLGLHHQPGFSFGFHNPGRIHGDEEEHDGISDKLSSASSDSRP